MDFKDLINSHFSRKAELVVVTIVGVVMVARIAEIPEKVVLCAIAGIVWTGTLGISWQGVIDYKHPKQQTDAPLVRSEETEAASSRA